MSTIRISGSIWAFGLLASAGCSEGGQADAAREDAMWLEAFPTFTRHEIAEFDAGGYATAFDVDGDGMRDIVALSASALVWFKNPTWERFNITTGTERFIHMAPYDIDGDGDVDLATASEFNLGDSNNGGSIHWAEAPDDPTVNQEWALHRIDALPTSHRLSWGDIDGDGRNELLNLPIIGIGASAPEYVGASHLTAYRIPMDPRGAWETTVLDDSLLEVAHGIDVVDWDGDSAEDILTASSVGVSLFRPALSGQPAHIGAGQEGPRPNRGSSEVDLGTLGGKRFIGTIEPWHGTDVVVYTPGESEGDLWAREVIGTEFGGGHGLVVADLNADGFDEIVAGDRGGNRHLLIFRYLPDADEWERIPLDPGGVAVSGVHVSDINGDGALDILVIGRATNNVVWYENSR